MPAATARRNYEDQIPSFMSVFDLDAETMADRETVTVVDHKLAEMDSKAPAVLNPSQQPQMRPGALPPDPAHQHHDSNSTQMSESADSSPTTTLSTTDSSPLSDPSPSSSPDSPVNLIPLNNFPATSFGMHSSNPNPSTLQAGSSVGFARPMTSPSPRRPRNMKGLSIQPPVVASATPQSLVSEPSSPSFIKPKIPAMKRKPSQLSLKTSTSDLITRTNLEVPPSPAMPPILQRRALKHSTSSPHMNAGMRSSTFGPLGGMTFPKVLERNESGLSEVLRPMKTSMNTTFEATTIMEEESPIKMQLASRADQEPYHERANNEDQKTPGYPDGPIAIYGDNVYLYLEPTADEASRFDVVINVAREVRNPFDVAKENEKSRQPSGADLSPIPDTAVTTASFATAFEYQPGDDDMVETPTTPKANPLKEPEYIHIPWDHNTDIAPDLMSLCETIDSRTKDGKKVLIHCQQGASRSASLIIAYGLYQKPDLSVNDAYYAAQGKSRWISPNMKLMYSLQDFHKQLSNGRLAPSAAYRSRPGRSPSKHRLTLSADAIDMAPKEPRTAPLPGEDVTMKDAEPMQGPTRPRGNSSPDRPGISPGPASAPPGGTWNTSVEDAQPSHSTMLAPFKVADLPQRPKSGQGRTESRSIELVEPAEPAEPAAPWAKPPPSPGFGSHASFGFQSMSFPSFKQQEPMHDSTPSAPTERVVTIPGAYPEDDALLSPRAETMTNNPLYEVPEVAGMRFVESPPTPTDGLFSPRVSMFPRDPFSPFGRPTQVADPRSPPTKGETPIVRSIDDIL